MSAFQEIKQGLQEAIYYQKGFVKNAKQHSFDDIDVKNIRESLHMSQHDFAAKFCLNLKSIQNWEQKRKKPSGATLVLLKVIASNPKAVLNALHFDN
ncbi:NadS family protein [Cysteiniphilum halobium]|uniref:NadS family protein n=1 Tax=Cysteiniphilum halobium TaxID=2219059 RepID=UPI000E655D8C|nr:NadS family protein [Cysteiniphilum halobium]